MNGFVKVEEFSAQEVGRAFIDLAIDGSSAKDDGEKTFNEFIRENADLFPGLDQENYAALAHANGLCREVWEMYEDEIEETFDAE